MLRLRPLLILGLCAGLGTALWWTRGDSTQLTLSISPSQLPADGYSKAIATIRASSKPRLFLSGKPLRAGSITQAPDGSWRADLRASIEPGTAVVRAEVNSVAQEASIELQPFLTDRQPNGMPDAVELDSSADQRAFRGWFTFLTEVQFFQTEPLPKEINDCAALLRYAYREALRAHDDTWAAAANIPVTLALPAIEKYQYPRTPLAASLFRIRPGAFAPADIKQGAFAQFADAQHLQQWNTHFVSRDLERAYPGDLLFFRHDEADLPFHAMIYLGRSQIDRTNTQRYVVYHTGPDGTNPGEIRRPSLDDLWRHPIPQWRPLPGNPTFLGVFRWNILASVTQ